MLGSMHTSGKGVEQSYVKAEEWLKKAAANGSGDALDLLLEITALAIVEASGGFNIPSKPPAAIYEQGKSAYNSEDYRTAFSIFSKLANEGDQKAQTYMGFLYKYENNAVSQSHPKAAEWFRKAANQGASSAQYNLAVMYYSGQGVPQSYEQTIKWYRKAAVQGDSDAQYGLGTLYYNGLGTAENYDIAVSWFKKAAVQNHEKAQAVLKQLGVQ